MTEVDEMKVLGVCLILAFVVMAGAVAQGPPQCSPGPLNGCCCIPAEHVGPGGGAIGCTRNCGPQSQGDGCVNDDGDYFDYTEWKNGRCITTPVLELDCSEQPVARWTDRWLCFCNGAMPPQCMGSKTGEQQLVPVVVCGNGNCPS